MRLFNKMLGLWEKGDTQGVKSMINQYAYGESSKCLDKLKDEDARIMFGSWKGHAGWAKWNALCNLNLA